MRKTLDAGAVFPAGDLLRRGEIAPQGNVPPGVYFSLHDEKCAKGVFKGEI